MASTADAKTTLETRWFNVSDLTTKTSETEGEMATAVTVRTKEQEAFVKMEAVHHIHEAAREEECDEYTKERRR